MHSDTKALVEPAPWRMPRGLAMSLASILLIVVACRQFYLTQTHELTPWLGGGFGMFASVDRIDHRVTRAYLLTSQGDLPIELPKLDGGIRLQMKAGIVPESDRLPGFETLNELRRLEMKARAMPTDERLADLAAVLAEWEGTQELLQTSLGNAAGDGTVDLAISVGLSSAWQGIRLEVWRLEFDADEVEIDAERLAELTYVGGAIPPVVAEVLAVETEMMP